MPNATMALRRVFVPFLSLSLFSALSRLRLSFSASISLAASCRPRKRGKEPMAMVGSKLDGDVATIAQLLGGEYLQA